MADWTRSIATVGQCIIATCFSLTVRDTIFWNASRLANTNVFISEDLPEEVGAKRAELRSVVMHAKQQEHNAILSNVTVQALTDGLTGTNRPT